MDLAGIEPASENPSTRVSTIIAVFLHSLGQTKNGILLTLVASYYARELKALFVSFPAIMTPVTEHAGAFGPTSGIKPLLNRNSCRLYLLFGSYCEPPRWLLVLQNPRRNLDRPVYEDDFHRLIYNIPKNQKKIISEQVF